METSVLKTIKKPLNIPADDNSFDQDLILFINSELYILSQLGINVLEPKMINEDTNWVDILGPETSLNQMAKEYIYLSVRIVFDPPQTVPALNALKEKRDETAWRIVEV